MCSYLQSKTHGRALGMVSVEFLNFFKEAAKRTPTLFCSSSGTIEAKLVEASLGRGDGPVPVSFPCSPVLGTGMGLVLWLFSLCLGKVLDIPPPPRLAPSPACALRLTQSLEKHLGGDCGVALPRAVPSLSPSLGPYVRKSGTSSLASLSLRAFAICLLLW